MTPASEKHAGCPLCEGPGGAPVFEGAKYRVIRAMEPGFPAFYRVVWNDHIAEFSQLPAADRQLCMDAVVHVEECLREHLAPDKVNLAALGNAVPHLHWHVIARFAWDSHFPGAVWAGSVRQPPPDRVAEIVSRITTLENDLGRRLLAGSGNCSPV